MAAKRGLPGWAQQLGSAVLQIAAQPNPGQALRDGTPRRIADQLGQWVGHLSRNAVIEWGPSMLRGELCAFCDEDSIGTCIGCSDSCCLGHAHVSHRAELLCDECVGRVISGVQQRQQGPEAQAFAYFHLTREATEREVLAAYRERSKDLHPDRGGTTAQMQELNRHHVVLSKYFDEKGKAA